MASFDILAKYSPFFATLRDLPRPDGLHASVIPLPSASSTGLALVISVLEDLNATSAADAGATVAGGGTEVDWTTVSEADLAHVTAAMEVADAYDIPAFTSYYIDKVHKAMDKNPSLAFTMAALGKDQQKAKQSARDILRLGHRLSTGMTALLQEHAPEYLDALRTFTSRYDRAHTKFLADLRSNETMENGFNDYGQMCKRDYHGCVTHDRYKSFRKMRVAYANQEFHKLVDIAFSESHWYHVNVGCQKCSTRISRCFRRALQNFEPAQWSFSV